MPLENLNKERKVDLVVERQWHIGMHARALKQMDLLGKVYGGFPAKRYLEQQVPPSHLKTFPLPALVNYAAGKIFPFLKFRLDEGARLSRSVARRERLPGTIVACYATAYRTLFPLLKGDGSILLLERGSTHPENYFHQIERARRDAGLEWTDKLPKDIEEEIEAGKLAHFIGAGSRMIADSYAERGYARERILTVPWCTNETFFSFHDRASRESREVVMVCVGMVGLRKGLGRLIKIGRWAERERIPLKIKVVGPLEVEAPRLLASAPSCIAWLGIQKGSALRRILHEADVYSLPSYEEGFGISVLEAMSTGLPAIVSEETGGKEAVEAGKNGLILAGYEDENLERELRPLLQEKQLRLEMGKLARETVEKTYTEKQYRKGIATEYGRMLGIVDLEGRNLEPAWREKFS